MQQLTGTRLLRRGARVQRPAVKLPASSSLRLVVVGVSDTALSLAVIWIALEVFRLSDVGANVIGFVWSFMPGHRQSCRCTS
jgi:hypothetical protein